MQRVGADAIAGTHVLQNDFPGPSRIRLDYPQFREAGTPIVIDNGSYHCRVGWASETSPRASFRSLVGRPKTRKDGDPSAYVGSGLFSVDWNRVNIKSAFEGGVCYHGDTQELVLDHAFSHLGIDADAVRHPVLLTECVCTPRAARKQQAEMLFEGYGVSSVAFGVDSLFSWRFNQPAASSDGMIVSAGHSATHVLPIVAGRLDFHNARRLDLAGAGQTDFMLQQLLVHPALQRNPALRGFVSAVQAQELKHRFCHLAPFNSFAHDITAAAARPPEQRCIIQIPFAPQPVPSEEELAARTAMRREQGKRLQELSAKRRRDRLAEHQKKLEVLLQLAEPGNISAAERRHQLAEHGFKTEALLEKEIDELQDRVTTMLQRMSGGSIQPPAKPARTYPLLEIDDDDLTPDQLKQKQVQKFLKAAALGREKAQLKQTQERAKKDAEEKKMQELKKNDPAGWEETVRRELDKLYLKKQQRERARQEANDRGSAMYRKRQRLVNSAADTGNDDDGFGENDDDWLVYLEMSREDNENDDDDDARIAELETMLAEHDPMSMYQSYEEQAAMWQLDIGGVCLRTAEIVYQPAMVGHDQAGLAEIISGVVQQYPDNLKAKLLGNVLVTGGAALTRGFKERLVGELTAIRPAEMEFNVTMADRPMEDAWRGAQQWCQQDDVGFRAALTTRAEHDECGAGYLKEHSYSNECYMKLKQAEALA